MGGTEPDNDSNTPAATFPEKYFEVPPLPSSVKKLVEPRDLRLSRLPPPGYDMRTLRKQVDALQLEIEERIGAQEEIYSQNRVLWDYLKALYRCSGENAQRLRDYFRELYQELVSVHRERYSLCQQLKILRNSENVLKLLAEEQGKVRAACDDDNVLRHEAELLLQQTKRENTELEKRLKTYLDRLSTSHQELEDLRHSRQDDENETLADHFRLHSKAVLRVAYSRFLRSIRARLRGSKIGHAVRSAYHSIIAAQAWGAWRAFLFRKKFMVTSTQRRCRESCQVFFARWKVYSALEKHFSNSRRIKLVKNTFQLWSEHVAAVAWEKWSLDAIHKFDIRKFTRKVFMAWKRTCMFLNWLSPSILGSECRAATHYLSKLLRAWGAVSRQSRQELQVLSYKVANTYKIRTHLFLWKDLCVSLWKRRGRYVRYFFSNARELVASQTTQRVSLMKAFSLWTGSRVRRALNTWLRIVRYRQRDRFGNSKQATLARLFN